MKKKTKKQTVRNGDGSETQSSKANISLPADDVVRFGEPCEITAVNNSVACS